MRVLPRIEPGSVDLVVTSPPYAMQRQAQYGGVPEVEYPRWTVAWMNALRPALREDASVFIVIRPNIKGGVISDYVLRTRLALRDDGWQECEELIWHKPDAPPLGSVQRPRRTWESVLWFSMTGKPFADLRAVGQDSSRVGFVGSSRFGEGGDSPLHSGQQWTVRDGRARCSDVIRAPIAGIDSGVDHPAMFPRALADSLTLTYSRPGGLVLDPFCGSGQVLLAAQDLGRRGLGVEIDSEYVRLARRRLRGVA